MNVAVPSGRDCMRLELTTSAFKLKMSQGIDVSSQSLLQNNPISFTSKVKHDRASLVLKVKLFLS